jgi:hypothetical protein
MYEKITEDSGASMDGWKEKYVNGLMLSGWSDGWM